MPARPSHALLSKFFNAEDRPSKTSIPLDVLKHRADSPLLFPPGHDLSYSWKGGLSSRYRLVKSRRGYRRPSFKSKFGLYLRFSKGTLRCRHRQSVFGDRLVLYPIDQTFDTDHGGQCFAGSTWVQEV